MPERLIAAGIIFAALGAIEGARRVFGAEARRWRWVRAIPITTVDSLVEGQVARVKGTVVDTDAVMLEGPMTGRPCVVYSVTMSGGLPTAGKTHRDATRFRVAEQSAQPIVVRDATGSVIVDLGSARLSLSRHRKRSSRRDDLSRLRTFAARNGQVGVQQASWREEILLPGDEIVVAGLVARELRPDAEAAERIYREELPTRLRFVGSAAHPLMLSD